MPRREASTKPHAVAPTTVTVIQASIVRVLNIACLVAPKLSRFDGGAVKFSSI